MSYHPGAGPTLPDHAAVPAARQRESIFERELDEQAHKPNASFANASAHRLEIQII